MSEPILIGIDPGAGGGIAWTRPGVGVVAVAMPADFEALSKLAKEIQDCVESHAIHEGGISGIICYVEQVSGYVKPSKAEVEEGERENRQPGHAMFTFGKNVGAEIMAMLMIGARIVEVHPTTWMKPFGLKKLGRGKTEWKNVLKSTAQRKFPQIKVTLKTADALLILAFASLKERGSAVLTLGSDQTHAGWDGARTAPPEIKETPEAAVAGACGNCHDCEKPFFHESEIFSWHTGRADGLILMLCNGCHSTRVNNLAQQNLFLCEWKDATWVFKRGEKNDVIIRRASELDMRQIQPGDE